MAFRLLRQLAFTLVVVTVVVLVGGGVYYAYDQTTLAAQARATPQVPPEAAAGGVADSVALGLPTGVNVATAHLLHGREDVAILDVRSQAEYDAWHLPGASLIPSEQLAARVEEVPREGVVIVVCRTGRRSVEAVELLQSAGFDNVHNLIGGVRAWDKAGFEVEP